MAGNRLLALFTLITVTSALLLNSVAGQEDAWLAVINNQQPPTEPQQAPQQNPQASQSSQYPPPPQENRRVDYGMLPPTSDSYRPPPALQPADPSNQQQQQGQRRQGDQETIYNYVEQPVDLPPQQQKKPARLPPPAQKPGQPLLPPPGGRRPGAGPPQLPQNPRQQLVGRNPSQQPPVRKPARRPPPPHLLQKPPGFQRPPPAQLPPHLRKRPGGPPVKPKQQGILQGISGAITHVVGDGLCAAQGLYADDKLKDPDFINYQLKCILGKGECDEVGSLVKRMAPDILRGGCPPPCDPCKKKQIQKVMATLSSKYPKEFKKLIQKYGK